jgi:hypothetical protein
MAGQACRATSNNQLSRRTPSDDSQIILAAERSGIANNGYLLFEQVSNHRPPCPELRN